MKVFDPFERIRKFIQINKVSEAKESRISRRKSQPIGLDLNDEKLLTLSYNSYMHAASEINLYLGSYRERMDKNDEQLKIIEKHFTGINSVEGIKIYLKGSDGKRHEAYLINDGLFNRSFFELMFFEKGKLPGWHEKDWQKA